jgi:hypothetical protein
MLRTNRDQVSTESLIDGIEPISIKQCAELADMYQSLLTKIQAWMTMNTLPLKFHRPVQTSRLSLIKQYFKHIGQTTFSDNQ